MVCARRLHVRERRLTLRLATQNAAIRKFGKSVEEACTPLAYGQGPALLELVMVAVPLLCIVGMMISFYQVAASRRMSSESSESTRVTETEKKHRGPTRMELIMEASKEPPRLRLRRPKTPCMCCTRE